MEASRYVGRVIAGRYHLIAPIGSGASATVFLAQDARLGRRIAIKMAHPALVGDSQFRRRFQAEARAAAQLSHPHLLPVFDWGDDPDVYLVTELLAGGSLRSMLEEGHRLSISQALVIGLHAAEGLSHAHRRGFVHRDIKPANLLFGSEGRLRVADFGIARAVAEAAWTEPEGALIGTARYAAPEQATGSSIDGRADIYALALTLIEAVTGSVPLVEGSPLGTMIRRQDTDLPVGEELGPLVSVLTQAGRVDPNERPDAAEFAQLLTAAATGLPRPRRLPLIRLDEDRLMASLDSGEVAGHGQVAAERVVVDPENDLIDLSDSLDSSVEGDGDDSGSFSKFDFGEELSGAAAEEYEPVESRGRIFAIALLMILLAGVAGAIALFPRDDEAPAVVVPEPVLLGNYVGQPIEDVRVDARVNGWVLTEEEQRIDDVAVGEIVAQTPVVGTELEEGAAINVVVASGAVLRTVPDVVGLTRLDAVARLGNAGLVLGTVDSTVFDEEAEVGIVLASTPTLGGEVETGTVVDLVVSAGPAPRIVPDLNGLTLVDADAAIVGLGLVPTLVEEYSMTAPQGTIISASPAAGAELARGDAVELIVSLGLPFVVVPDLTDLRGGEADEQLTAAGFVVVDTVGPPNGEVLGTDPPAGESHRHGSEIRIFTRQR